ncbi:MAG TPA: hypothetical protein VGG10_18540, partial [Rhizomicrobium sp.]
RPEQEQWIKRFGCEINGADYLLALFTIILAISTILLWRETERLARGAEDSQRQLEKMSRGNLLPENSYVSLRQRGDAAPEYTVIVRLKNSGQSSVTLTTSRIRVIYVDTLKGWRSYGQNARDERNVVGPGMTIDIWGMGGGGGEVTPSGFLLEVGCRYAYLGDDGKEQPTTEIWYRTQVFDKHSDGQWPLLRSVAREGQGLDDD